MSLKELRSLLKEKKKVIFGKKETLKNLKRGSTKQVFLASNCDKETKETIKKYAKMSDAKVFELDEPNDELTLICKREHIISVVSH